MKTFIIPYSDTLLEVCKVPSTERFNARHWNRKVIQHYVSLLSFSPHFQVGAAISMAYITGQPIVFVGTGQTYTDLRKLDAKAVVYALMK